MAARLAASLLFCSSLLPAADIVIYGGSAAGVTAAIQSARMGRTVELIEPYGHVGGFAVEGLGSSDVNNHEFRNDIGFGGLAREFYQRIGRAYGKGEPIYKFESSVAERVYNEWLAEHRVSIRRHHTLTRVHFHPNSRRIAALEFANGARVEGRVFLDATIEGDLLALAGIRTVIGRESNATYNETKNGIRDVNTYRQFAVRVDPYRIPGNPTSGLIPTIQDEPFGTPGSGDHRLQGFCFRLCLTRNPSNQTPVAKPPSYSKANYEIYRRYMAAGGKLFTPGANLPNGKTDLGSWHDLSANLYGMNFDYPGGDHATRARITREHREFTQGLIWYLQNEPEVTEATRAAWLGWGLCADEFTDNANWPRSLYVRDARRMVGPYVITEHHTRRVNPTPVEDPIAVSYWPPDTHHVRRIVRDGAAYNEGFVFGGDEWGPFGISYRSLLPNPAEADNLLTPTCLSSSHVAYGAIRIEWTFMALGQAAATAAVLALDSSTPLHALPYATLRTRLLRDGQVVGLNLPLKK